MLGILEFDEHREQYIAAIKTKTFPWRPAFYYYENHIDKAEEDIMDFTKFKQTITLMSKQVENELEQVGEPIYEALDRYYGVVYVFDLNENYLTVV